ncbi:MAG: peroxidase family protein [Tepidisphaeraceae bacterium]
MVRPLVSLRSRFDTLETRQLMAADARSFDGSGNNLTQSSWGSVGASLIRLAANGYGDGKSTPAGASRASARAISNSVVDHGPDPILDERRLSSFAYLWGQFIDHDLDLTDSALPAEAFNIAVPKGDAHFDPKSTGTQVIPLSRSQYVTGANGTRQQTNSITAFLDGSMVYGSDKTRADALRTFARGLLKTSAGNMLPYNTAGLSNATLGGPASSYYLAGDVRANENVELTSLQTLFVREHNRIATDIAKRNPSLTDEQIYQQARKIVGGEIQAITYNEYLPALLGAGAIASYSGYKPNVNAGISTEFSTAAFRTGHSMLSDDVEFLNNDGTDFRDEISLAEAFFNPSLVASTGIDPIMKYLASSNSEKIDVKVVDSLRNFLFGPPGSGGLDLASLNIQRGRDHGLADYNSTRAALGLPKVTSFAQITSDVSVQKALASVYVSVNDIDLWVGGLAEDHVRGSAVGATFQRILVDQFTRTRDGDRFWYQRDLSPQDVQRVSSTHLADIIRANTGTTNIQADVFTFRAEVNGQVFDDRNTDGRPNPGEGGLARATVSLINSVGETVLNTLTDAAGRYHLQDIPLGQYTLKVAGPNGFVATRPAPALSLTRGIVLNGVDVGLRNTSTPAPAPAPLPPPPRPAVASTLGLFGNNRVV